MRSTEVVGHSYSGEEEKFHFIVNRYLLRSVMNVGSKGGR